MSLFRKIFGSGIRDDEKDHYTARSEDFERRQSEEKRVLYTEVMSAKQSATVFKSTAGKMRMMRGEQ